MKATLQSLFTMLGIGPMFATILTVAIPLIALLGGGLAWVVARRKKKAAPAPSATAAPGAAPPQPKLGPYKLRAAFLRFSAELPAAYRRSLQNFEHFVVLGPAGSGKSRVIDGATDWKRRTKEFVASQAVDPDLQVFLTSSAVVTELPAAILEDHSDRCRTALRHLWKPLYKSRAPTIVVVVDAMRLASSTSDAIRDLAETIRSKINVISQIRRAPVEVRVVLTRLDQLVGYADFAQFALASGLPTRVTFNPFGEKPDVKGDLEQWFDGLRGHLPRALTRLSSDAFRRVVVFFRRLPELAPTLAPFLETLFAREPRSPDPVVGGLFLIGDAASVSNPLKGAAEVGPGPDPRRKHLIGAAVVGAAAVTYLTVAYLQQRAVWSKAVTELDEYSANTYGSEREARRREEITQFTYRTRGVLLRFPDYFEGSRRKMRKRFSDAVREELIIPRLREFAQKGRTENGGIALPQRRSLYCLALIHSDHDDRMQILNAKHLFVWASMTGLSSELIRDYIGNVDVALTRPIEFEMSAHGIDPSDSTASWVLFFRKIQEVLADGIVEIGELRELRARANVLTKALDRFDHDDITRGIIGQLDDAAGIGDKTGDGHLKRAYQPKYDDFLQNITSSDILGQRVALRRILGAVETTAIDSNGAVLLRSLLDRLALLYATEHAAHPEDAVRVTLGGQEFVFDLQKWALAIRDSAAAEEISQFIRQGSGAGSMFFGSSDDDARPLVWNPTNDGSVLFTGKGSIEGRYTRPAYDKHVRAPVKKLAEVLEKNHVPDDRKAELREFVREQVRKYATEYRRQLTAFYRSFGLSASSPEALRVAVSQMVSEASPFNDFIVAVDRQLTLEVDDPNLDAMGDVMSEFAAWHGAVSPGSGTPEIAKYKAILAQLLADLGPPPGASSAAPAAAVVLAAEEPATSTNGQTLEKALSPAGRLVLSNLRGDSGAYGNMVAAWVASIKLPEYQRAPFLAPIVQLGAIGRRDIERIVDQAWEREMMPDVQRIADRFPFAKDAVDDVTPQELTSVLHPQTGRFFDLYRRFLEPISELDATGYHLRRALRGSIATPSGMYSTLSQAGLLSSRLWDATGKPLALDVRIATVPFEHGPDPRLALTITYMNAGATPVVNFNQKPTEKTVHFDWMKEQASQVGMQLTDLDTKESAFPEPLVVDPSFWSLHKLLRKGVPSAVKHPPDAVLYSWELHVRKGRPETSRVRFVVIGDPFLPFQLLRTSNGGAGRSARLQRTVGQGQSLPASAPTAAGGANASSLAPSASGIK